MYLQNIFIKIASKYPNLQISSIRPNYNTKAMIKNLYKFENPFSYLRFDKYWIDLAAVEMEFNIELVSTLVELWYNFKENRFVFYQMEPEMTEKDDLSNLVLDNLENATKKQYVIF